MKINLYLLVSHSFPKEVANGDNLILVKDNKEPEVQVELDELYFVSTLGIKSNKPDIVLEEFQTWWMDNVGTEIQTQCLTRDINSLQDYRKTEIIALSDNEWTLKTDFVAYPKNSKSAFLNVIDFIRESELNPKECRSDSEQ